MSNDSLKENQIYEVIIKIDEDMKKVLENCCPTLLIFDGCIIRNSRPGVALEAARQITENMKNCINS